MTRRRFGGRGATRTVFTVLWIALGGLSGFYLFTLFTNPTAAGFQLARPSPTMDAPAAPMPTAAPPPPPEMASSDISALEATLQGLSQRLADLDERFRHRSPRRRQKNRSQSPNLSCWRLRLCRNPHHPQNLSPHLWSRPPPRRSNHRRRPPRPPLSHLPRLHRNPQLWRHRHLPHLLWQPLQNCQRPLRWSSPLLQPRHLSRLRPWLSQKSLRKRWKSRPTIQ